MKTFVIGDVHGRGAQLANLLDMLPRDPAKDMLILLGDLIDRGFDAPGCVEQVIKLCKGNPKRVICLRGNHEQMILDFIEGRADIWISPVTGGERTFEQYTGSPLIAHTQAELKDARKIVGSKVPEEHLNFFRRLPYYYEDEFAIYVHAGLEHGKHPRDSNPESLLWLRDMEFYKNYKGKPCVFGHTPTPFLPLRGRLGRHGIYISNSAIGIDSGYNHHSPLSCLSLPDFTLYQTFADGREETHRITSFIPEPLKKMQRRAALPREQTII
ncbi:MAG TPA: metallophosphoesterase family protein [Pyrinomonadaceae bacterium]|jgi:serine/threonine protein phosphatase 1|nr:metallophosphoesterase family protein [Pyrinomonadaceae bacterium]